MKTILKKLLNYLHTLLDDKKLHFFAGLIISIFTFCVIAVGHPKYCILSYAFVGIISATVIGMLKEYVWDAWLSRRITVKNLWKKFFNTNLPDGCVEFKDLLYTIYGGFAGAILMLIILILL